MFDISYLYHNIILKITQMFDIWYFILLSMVALQIINTHEHCFLIILTLAPTSGPNYHAAPLSPCVKELLVHFPVLDLLS